jgi:hypothetical protein
MGGIETMGKAENTIFQACIILILFQMRNCILDWPMGRQYEQYHYRRHIYNIFFRKLFNLTRVKKQR